MYGSVDHMIDKMVTQLQRKKEKLKDHKHQKAPIPFSAVPADDDIEAVAIDAADIVKFEKVAKQRR
jgi:hypothetical protein